MRANAISLLFLSLGLIGSFFTLKHLFESTSWDVEAITSITTILTLIVTIIIARQSDTRRRTEAHDRAIIAAAGLSPRITLAVHELRELCAYVASDKYKVDSDKVVEVHLSSLDSVNLWTDEEVLPLVSLPNRVAARLIAIRLRIEEYGRIYAQYSKHGSQYRAVRRQGLNPSDEHPEMGRTIEDLANIDQQLRKLLEELRNFKI